MHRKWKKLKNSKTPERGKLAYWTKKTLIKTVGISEKPSRLFVPTTAIEASFTILTASFDSMFVHQQFFNI